MTLFEPLRLREIEFKNRIGVSPMCQYSAKDGHPGTWHLVHLGSRAVGGAALVMTEASAVQEVGRISPTDAGMYVDAHVESWRPTVVFLKEQGAVPGMQLAHAGRKASTAAPWFGRAAHARAGRLDAGLIHQRSFWCWPSRAARNDSGGTRSGRG